MRIDVSTYPSGWTSRLKRHSRSFTGSVNLTWRVDTGNICPGQKLIQSFHACHAITRPRERLRRRYVVELRSRNINEIKWKESLKDLKEFALKKESQKNNISKYSFFAIEHWEIRNKFQETKVFFTDATTGGVVSEEKHECSGRVGGKKWRERREKQGMLIDVLLTATENHYTRVFAAAVNHPLPTLNPSLFHHRFSSWENR